MGIQYLLEKMASLKLSGMANEFERQISNPEISDIPFEQRLSMLIDHEITFRDSKRIQMLLKKAKLQMNACVEEIDYRTPRGIDKSHLLSLTSLDWIQQKQNLVITGPTGTGKTWLSCAFGNQACRTGLTTYFVRVSLLKEDFMSAHATGNFRKSLALLAKYDLLILDDWGMRSLSDRSQEDMLELIDARVGAKSTIFCSQFPAEKWHDTISNKTIADAILDRLVHSSHTLKLSGESLRRKSKKTKQSLP